MRRFRFKKIFRPKRLLLYAFALGLFGLAFAWGAQKYVAHKSEGLCFESIQDIPQNKVGLVLGCNKYVGGRENLFYLYRMRAAAQLYKSGKVKHLLVSGDNGSTQYDEPSTMKVDLVALGVPARNITLDYAGFRTLDSVVRCSTVFGQKSITVISQKFHNERAIAIGRAKGLNMVGYNAKSPQGKTAQNTYNREKLARIKMALDLIFGTEPKFYGDKITIAV